jgi:hypothetical protein
MGVGPHPAVKAFFPPYYPYGNNFPFLQEKADIPIHGPQGKSGDDRFKLLIHPVGAGVGRDGPDHREYLVPLPAVFSDCPVHDLIDTP